MEFEWTYCLVIDTLLFLEILTKLRLVQPKAHLDSKTVLRQIFK